MAILMAILSGGPRGVKGPCAALQQRFQVRPHHFLHATDACIFQQFVHLRAAPPPEAAEDCNCFFIDELSPERITQRVIQLARVGLPVLGFRHSDIVVLAPMDKGKAGSL